MRKQFLLFSAIAMLVLAGRSDGQECVDFTTFAAGSVGPNPRVEEGITFMVFDYTMTPVTQTAILDWGGSPGLHVNYWTWVLLPTPATMVEATLMHFQPAAAAIEAFDAAGASVGTATMSQTQGQAETLQITGAGIVAVVITAPQDEAGLLSFCTDAVPEECWDRCVDFTTFPLHSTGPNPRGEGGIFFAVFDHAGLPVAETYIEIVHVGFTGLHLGHETQVLLPAPATTIEATLVYAVHPATIEAFDATGASVGTAAMIQKAAQAETLHITGPGIVRVVITDPQDEVVLRKFCMRCGPVAVEPSSWGQIKAILR
jgi:hypothetical protein